MNPELRERLEQHAAWHVVEAERLTFHTPNEATRYHNGAAADIRAAIVSADDATKNLLTFRHHLAERRKYAEEPEAITGFDQLEGKS